jgi:AcrR family transcriptional regulator
MVGSSTRTYDMSRRAEEIERTRKAILDAAIEIADRRASLPEIAARAGVSERTILRHFGSRDGLRVAAIRENTGRLRVDRFSVPAGDAPQAVAALVDQYEGWGHLILDLLAEEGAAVEIDRLLAEGREMHRRWVVEKLGPLLGDCAAATRRRRVAQLAAICDVYTWKLLRRDSGFGRAETEQAIRELIEATVANGGPSPR